MELSRVKDPWVHQWCAIWCVAHVGRNTYRHDAEQFVYCEGLSSSLLALANGRQNSGVSCPQPDVVAGSTVGSLGDKVEHDVGDSFWHHAGGEICLVRF